MCRAKYQKQPSEQKKVQMAAFSISISVSYKSTCEWKIFCVLIIMCVQWNTARSVPETGFGLHDIPSDIP